MFTHSWKFAKHVFMILSMLLVLTGVMGVPPSPVQAGQALAAPLPEGVKPSLPELVTENVNGRLFPPGNGEETARCMEWFADHPERWSGMGTASLEKVQPHSLENIVSQYETLYGKLLAGVHLE